MQYLRWDTISPILFQILWAFAFSWVAYRKGFYTSRVENPRTILFLSHTQLFIPFGMYLFFGFFLNKILFGWIYSNFILSQSNTLRSQITLLAVLHFFSMALSLGFIYFWMRQKDRVLGKKLWKDFNFPFSKPVEFDFGLGVITWFLTFPIVSGLGGIFELIFKMLGLEKQEQNAVKFMKITMSSPLALTFALLSVLVMAPLLEELLFRGYLMNYLKKRIGVPAAILLSALTFALFHFSTSQGYENISFVISLFILGVYLGFLYQRQNSLWAPIGLHMTFNMISAFRIFLSPEIPL